MEDWGWDWEEEADGMLKSVSTAIWSFKSEGENKLNYCILKLELK
jgi:hypothetical protein